MSISFVRVFLESQHVALGARRADFLRALVGEAAGGEQGEIGGGTGPGTPKPFLDGTFEVGHGPELAVRGGRLRAEELTWGVLVTLDTHGLALVRGERGAVAAEPAIDQGGHAVVAVEATPVQEAGTAAAGDFGDLGDGIGGAVEADGLVARAGGPIPTVVVGLA